MSELDLQPFYNQHFILKKSGQRGADCLTYWNKSWVQRVFPAVFCIGSAVFLFLLIRNPAVSRGLLLFPLSFLLVGIAIWRQMESETKQVTFDRSSQIAGFSMVSKGRTNSQAIPFCELGGLSLESASTGLDGSGQDWGLALVLKSSEKKLWLGKRPFESSIDRSYHQKHAEELAAFTGLHLFNTQDTASPAP